MLLYITFAVSLFLGTWKSFNFQTYFSAELILGGAKTLWREKNQAGIL